MAAEPGCGATVLHVGQAAAEIHADDVAKVTGVRPVVWLCACGYWHTGERPPAREEKPCTYLLGFITGFKEQYTAAQNAEIYRALAAVLDDTRREQTAKRKELEAECRRLNHALTAEILRRHALELRAVSQ